MKKHFSNLLSPFFGGTSRSSMLSGVLRLLLLGALTFSSLNSTVSAQCQTCCNGSKPKSLVLLYNGLPCSASVTCQAADKWSCEGVGPNNAASVYITASKNSDGSGGTYFAGTVTLNSEFTANSASGGSSTFPSNTYFRILSSQSGTLLQLIKIHTSCSTPLVAGDQFGSLRLQKITLADGTNCNAPPPPPPPPTCPTPVITINNTTPTNVGQLCKGTQIIFKTTDLGYPCISYNWNFGANATPPTASGIGPHTVTYSAAGSATVTLSTDNDCEGGVGTTICPPPPPPPVGSDCCDDNSGKPKSLKLKYTGQGCSSTNTSQGSDKYSCDDLGEGPNGDPAVYIIANEKADGTGTTYFSGNVNLNATFTATSPSNTLPTNTYFLIYASQGGTLLQKIKIHTSCSAPIVPGEQFGSLLLESATWSTGVTCDINSGGGNSGGGSGGADCCDSNSGKPKSLTLMYNGESCSQTSTSQGSDKYSCDDLGSGPNGDATVWIVANEKADGSGITYFSGLVNLNATFTATSPSSTLPTNTYFLIYGSQGGTLLQKVKIHTSCSAPIVPGDQFGSLVLLAATWSTGVTCGQTTPPGPDCIDCDKTVTTTINIVDCNPCDVNLAVSNIVCNGNGTSTTTDDTYTFVINVTGTNTSGNWQGGFSNAFLGAFAIGPTPYNTPITLGPFPAGQFTSGNTNPPITVQNGLNIDVSVSDSQNPNCSDFTTVVSPGPCSPAATASLGDFVWNDLNQNGAQNAGEPGVQLVTVNLYKCDNTFVATTTTNNVGFYQFLNLAPNMQYFVEFVLPAGYQRSPMDATADNIDSDANTTTGRTACTFLSPGEYDNSIDAGIYQTTNTGPGKVGDFVWFETDGDGIQEAGEPGIPNVFVILETCTGQFVNFTTTNDQGMYMFNNVQPGQYRIKFASPGTYNGVPIQLTAQNAGNDDAKDSDADWLGFTACFTLGAGEINLTLDAGFTGEAPPQICTINGTVSNIVCDNHGTPNNAADDTYTFTLVVNGTNTGDWGYDIPSLNLFMLQYGQPYNLGPFNIGAGTLTLHINDHDVLNCTTKVHVTPPPPCSAGGGTGNPCDNVTFSGSGNKVTITGLSAPIEIVKVWNSAWQEVFSCTANCADPSVTGILPAGTYFVKVQMFSAAWGLICTKEGYVTVSNFTGGVGTTAISAPTGGGETGNQSNVEDRSNPLVESSALNLPVGIEFHPNPTSGLVRVSVQGVDGLPATLRITDQLGREVWRVNTSYYSADLFDVDLSSLNNGQYIIWMVAEGQLPIAKKLMVAKF
ncbi:MAG: hypothetical protein HY842_12290 [Bacteroidetes bacterium]|nr:hypothetical protein [Bacteroidota bacterium]